MVFPILIFIMFGVAVCKDLSRYRITYFPRSEYSAFFYQFINFLQLESISSSPVLSFMQISYGYVRVHDNNNIVTRIYR